MNFLCFLPIIILIGRDGADWWTQLGQKDSGCEARWSWGEWLAPKIFGRKHRYSTICKIILHEETPYFFVFCINSIHDKIEITTKNNFLEVRNKITWMTTLSLLVQIAFMFRNTCFSFLYKLCWCDWHNPFKDLFSLAISSSNCG